MVSVIGLAAAALLVAMVVEAWKLAEWVWWKPRRLGRALRAQGLKGTHYRLLYGDLKDVARSAADVQTRAMGLSHDIIPWTSPFIQNAMRKNGKMSYFWFGPYPRVIVSDPEMVREILNDKTGHFEKPKSNPFTKLQSSGLAIYEGEKWAKHRRLLNPAFHLEKLKLMLPAFSICCDELIKSWEKLVGSSGSCEVDVWPHLQSFTGDVISRAAFGSCFEEGRRIFQLQIEQAELALRASQTVNIPGFRYLPTRQNLRRREIDREVRARLLGIIKKRESDMKNGAANNEDLLGLLMESNSSGLVDGQTKSTGRGMSTDEMIEECKLFYFAGQETIAVLLNWIVITLALDPDWQAKARQEILGVFRLDKPDFDGLASLKIVTMIVNEVLRLYPPAVYLVRETCKEAKMGEFTIPSHVQLLMPLLFIHHDTELWGEDADKFNPERFSEGVARASKNQVAFFPFGWGSRNCIGTSFALLEAKIALARILQHFEFEISKSYTHAPRTILTLQPKYGAPVILHRL